MDTNSNLRTVTVELGNNSYPIYIGSGLLSQADLLAKHADSKQIAIVTNSVIAELYLPRLQASLRQNQPQVQLTTIELPEGENNKSQPTLQLIYDRLIEEKFSRDCLIIALGGGIVGDIAGYAAATYQRGVKFIQIPTTLLAQVDSSVGGKTGINHRLGKNLIGAFYQPQAVVIDTDVLQSLPPRELAAGMAEVIKYGLIRDIDFLNHLHEVMPTAMSLQGQAIADIIERSCRHKAAVVAADEKEKGERATLNLGHTFGHAIETLTHYNTYLHGEAIAIGMMMAMTLSQRLGWVSEADKAFAKQLFEQANCPTDLHTCQIPLTATQIREAMQRDKKVAAGKLKLILLNPVGSAVIRDDIAEPMILQTIEAYL